MKPIVTMMTRRTLMKKAAHRSGKCRTVGLASLMIEKDNSIALTANTDVVRLVFHITEDELTGMSFYPPIGSRKKRILPFRSALP